ncbi:MAG: prepilin-type N-terminal cleavage/methylation domain-containing protein [Armatimonadetes bacterium]|nr:prepilin-type N-terminal cleavage/methylation domain-containing protein [Armatimonadota bacterium]
MWLASTHRRRGLTLIEVLIASGIMSMVLLATYSVLVLSMRYQRKQDDTVTIFQQAVIAGTKIQQSLANGAAGSVETDADGFAFVSALNPDALFEHDETTGLLKWQKFVCFYRENDVLKVKEKSFAPTTDLPATPSVATLIADPSATPRTVAENVTALQILSADTSVEFFLTARSKAEAPNSVSVRNRVFLRQ